MGRRVFLKDGRSKKNLWSSFFSNPVREEERLLCFSTKHTSEPFYFITKYPLNLLNLWCTQFPSSLFKCAAGCSLYCSSWVNFLPKVFGQKRATSVTGLIIKVIDFYGNSPMTVNNLLKGSNKGTPGTWLRHSSSFCAHKSLSAHWGWGRIVGDYPSLWGLLSNEAQ